MRELRQKKVFVMPVMHKKCRIPGFLSEKVWADMVGRKYRTGLASIVERLREIEG